MIRTLGTWEFHKNSTKISKRQTNSQQLGGTIHVIGGRRQDSTHSRCSFPQPPPRTADSFCLSLSIARGLIFSCSSATNSSANQPITNSFPIPGGFNEFRRKFPELCDASTTVLNTPQTPCTPLQLPNFNEPNRMSNSVSESTLNLRSSNDGSTPEAPMTQILDFVFLGSQQDAQNPVILKKYGITKVINLSDCPKSDLIPQNNFLRIPIRDSYEGRFLQAFKIGLNFHFLNIYSHFSIKGQRTVSSHRRVIVVFCIRKADLRYWPKIGMYNLYEKHRPTNKAQSVHKNRMTSKHFFDVENVHTLFTYFRKH